MLMNRGVESFFRAAIRGGNWDNTTNDGPFTLNLNNAPSNVNTNIGFRCASIHANLAPEQNRHFTEWRSLTNVKDLDDYRLGYRIPPKAGETPNQTVAGSGQTPPPAVLRRGFRPLGNEIQEVFPIDDLIIGVRVCF